MWSVLRHERRRRWRSRSDARHERKRIDAQLAVARVRRRAEGLAARPAIEAALGRVLALVRETGARGFEPHVYVERAELAQLIGDEGSRERELREAHRLFTEIGAPIRAAEVAKELAQ